MSPFDQWVFNAPTPPHWRVVCRKGVAYSGRFEWYEGSYVAMGVILVGFWSKVGGTIGMGA